MILDFKDQNVIHQEFFLVLLRQFFLDFSITFEVVTIKVYETQAIEIFRNV